MRVASKSRFAIVFLMLLGMGLYLGLPAEDVLDAVYDESEALPCEDAPLFSIVMSPLAASRTQAPLSALHRVPGAPSTFALVSLRHAGIQQSAAVRTSLALLCALLC
jgi:hypothetical protein